MARQLRIQFEGALYHVISRGNERKMIILDDDDRIKYINILYNTVERFNWLWFLGVRPPVLSMSKGELWHTPTECKK